MHWRVQRSRFAVVLSQVSACRAEAAESGRGEEVEEVSYCSEVFCQNFAEKFSVESSGCWLWNSFKGSRGEGLYFICGRSVAARKMLYIATFGEIPKNSIVYGTCGESSCVNPFHSEIKQRNPSIPKGTPINDIAFHEGFVRDVDFSLGGCWEWVSLLDNRGYGKKKFGGKIYQAHRLMFRATHGDIPRDANLKNICGSKSCVNPEHWEVYRNWDSDTPLRDRFFADLEKVDSGCWEWCGTTNEDGYGRISDGTSSVAAHRFSFEFFHHPILDNQFFVCHTCDNPSCVNPDHLFLGTNDDNQRDKCEKGRHWNSAKTHCKRGHLLGGENLKIDAHGKRQCRECNRIRDRICKAKRMAS